MTTALPTLREHRMPRRRRSRSTLPRLSVSDLTIRIVLAAALVGGVVWMLVQADTVRAAEAHFAAWWMDGWIPGGVTASADTYMLWLDDSHLVGFQVTAECTALILLVPLLALGACFVLSARVSVPRAIAGTVASSVVMVLVNQVRLALIGFSTLQGGLGSGYEFGHRFAGSVVGIAGFAVGLVVLIAVAGVRRRR